MTDNIETLRQQLKAKLGKPPKGLASASIQGVRDYKARHLRATELLKKKTAKATELQGAINMMG